MRVPQACRQLDKIFADWHTEDDLKNDDDTAISFTKRDYVRASREPLFTGIFDWLLKLKPLGTLWGSNLKEVKPFPNDYWGLLHPY